MSRLNNIRNFFIIIMLTPLIITPVNADTEVMPNLIAIHPASPHTLGLGNDGTVWGWGLSYMGSCGVVTNDEHPYILVLKPHKIPELDHVKAISGGDGFSLALKEDGTVWAWGSNKAGVLGIGSYDEEEHPIPVQVQGISGVIDIAGGSNYVIALKEDGTVWAWGCNNNGRLGDGKDLVSEINNNDDPNKYHCLPEKVVDLTDIISIDSAEESSIAVKSDGTVWVWGRYWGVVEDGSKNSASHASSIPLQVRSISDARVASIGCDHAMVLKKDGTVWTWGCSLHGRLGYPTDTDTIYIPLQVHGLSNITMIDCSTANSYAVSKDGRIFAWGANWDGQIGDGTKKHRESPVIVNVPRSIWICANGAIVFVIDNEDMIWAWGADSVNQLGDGASGDNLIRKSPVLIQFNKQEGKVTPEPTIHTIFANATQVPVVPDNLPENTSTAAQSSGFNVWQTVIPLLFVFIFYPIIPLIFRTKK